MKYRIWQKITKTGEIEVEDDAQVISIEDVKDDNTQKEYQLVTYIVPIKQKEEGWIN